MNIIDLQDKLKNFSQDQLVQEMQMPTGQLPQFLLLSEITRRQKMRESFAQQQGQEETTVAQDAINAAGMPQDAAQQLAGTMAPQTDMAGNTGAMPQQQQMMPEATQTVQGMAGGGIVALRDGGAIDGQGEIVVRDGIPYVIDADGTERPLGGAAFSQPLSRSQLAMLERNQPRPMTGAPEMAAPSIGDVPAMPTPQTAPPLMPLQSPQPQYDLPDFRPVPQGGGFPLPAHVANDPALQLMAQRAGQSVEDYWATMDPRAQQAHVERFGAGVAQQFEPFDITSDLDRRNQIRDFGFLASRPMPAADPGGSLDYLALSDMTGMPGMPQDAARGTPVPGMPAPADTGDRRPTRDVTANPRDPSRRTFTDMVSGAMSSVESAVPRPDANHEFFQPGGALSDLGQLVARYGSVAKNMVPAAAATVNTAINPVVRYATGYEFPVPEFNLSGTPNDSTRGTPLTTPDNPADLLPPAPTAPTAPVVPGGPGGGGGGGGGGIGAMAAGGAKSSFEQELMGMMEARAKRAEQDKWLALAQAGMALMSSSQPTFGGALGEAGASGLGALRESQAGSEADRLGLLGQLEQSRLGREQVDLQRQALAARSAAGGGGAMAAQDPSAFGLSTDEDRQLTLFLRLAESPNLATQLEGQRGVDELLARVQARSNMGGASGTPSVMAPSARSN